MARRAFDCGNSIDMCTGAHALAWRDGRGACTIERKFVKTHLALLALVACVAAPPVASQVFSWDPLKDIENALPEGVPNESRIIQGRHQVREMTQDALATLIEITPSARRAIDRSAGYAVFSTFGVKLFFAGGTTGKGMVVNQRTHRQTFMKMVQVQGGLGFGLNQNRLIFVFTTEQALRNFIDQGWEFGGQANLSAIAGGQGAMFSGAAAVAPNVFLYQLTNTGLSATLTVSGTKFFKDSDLN
jgi:lipid-binding SYLF domain-containing protein